jgi:hypothetical protein
MRTQEQIVVQHLRENGKITRNWALSQRITRLAAIIANLKNSGLEIEGKKERTLGGYGRSWDYTYRLIHRDRVEINN